MRRITFSLGRSSEIVPTVLRAVMVLGVLATGVVFSACQPQRRAPTADERRAAQPYVLHTVQYPGETLSIIAGWYTGSARNWEFLKEANPGLNPNRIRLGDVIRVPRELVTREDPMPRSALPGGQRKGSQGAPPAATRPQDAQPEVPSMTEKDAPLPEAQSESFPLADAADNQASEDDERPALPEPEAPSATVESLPLDSGSMEDQAPSAETVPSEAPSEPSAEAPSAPETKPEMKIKSRDELLKELLEE